MLWFRLVEACRCFAQDCCGSNAVEYALLGSLVAVTISAALFAMTGEGAGIWQESVQEIVDAIADRGS